MARTPEEQVWRGLWSLDHYFLLTAPTPPLPVLPSPTRFLEILSSSTVLKTFFPVATTFSPSAPCLCRVARWGGGGEGFELGVRGLGSQLGL